MITFRAQADKKEEPDELNFEKIYYLKQQGRKSRIAFLKAEKRKVIVFFNFFINLSLFILF